MKTRRAVDAVAIEQRERRIAERRRAVDERFGQRGAVEKGKRGRGVEFDVHRCEMLSASVLQCSVIRCCLATDWLTRRGLRQSKMPSRNHRSVVPIVEQRGRRRHRSAPRPIRRDSIDRRSHQPPDVRHGRRPARTRPPGMPRRSIATCTGRPRFDADAHGDRRTEAARATAGGELRWAGRRRRCRIGTVRDLRRACGTAPSRSASGRWVSSSTGDPQRASPTSAPSRAVSVASVSGDGIARSSSENWMMRPGAGSTSMVTMSTAADGGMRFEIEQQQRAQHARIAHRRRQLQHARVRGPIGRAADRGGSPRRRDRRARAPPPAARAAARTRTTAARASRSAIRARIDSMNRGTPGSGTSGRGSRPRASRCSATPRRPSRADSSAAGSAARSRASTVPSAAARRTSALRRIAACRCDCALAARPRVSRRHCSSTASGSVAQCRLADRRLRPSTPAPRAASRIAAVCDGATADATAHRPVDQLGRDRCRHRRAAAPGRRRRAPPCRRDDARCAARNPCAIAAARSCRGADAARAARGAHDGR